MSSSVESEEFRAAVKDLQETTIARFEDRSECPFEVDRDFKKELLRLLARAIIRDVVQIAVTKAVGLPHDP